MSESALNRAVRDRIRLNDEFLDRQVEIELDEFAPPTTGDLYVIVIPAGFEPGPSHETNAGASDLLYNVDVSIAVRAPRVPRDRQRSLFTALARSFEVYQRAILAQVDFQYQVRLAANAYILAETASSEGFMEDLKFSGTGPFRQATSDLFLSVSGETVAAVIRQMHFRGARRIVTRTQV